MIWVRTHLIHQAWSLVTWGGRHELEGAFGVEGVDQSRGRYGTLHVKIIVTYAAFVTRSYADFFAAITFEGECIVLKSELVLGVAEVWYLTVFHGSSVCCVLLMRMCILLSKGNCIYKWRACDVDLCWLEGQLQWFGIVLAYGWSDWKGIIPPPEMVVMMVIESSWENHHVNVKEKSQT